MPRHRGADVHHHLVVFPYTTMGIRTRRFRTLQTTTADPSLCLCLTCARVECRRRRRWGVCMSSSSSSFVVLQWLAYSGLRPPKMESLRPHVVHSPSHACTLSLSLSHLLAQLVEQGNDKIAKVETDWLSDWWLGACARGTAQSNTSFACVSVVQWPQTFHLSN